MTKYITYFRVSTAQQGRSGLGLEAQKSTVDEFLRRQRNAVVGDTIVEIESGKRSDRPGLMKALNLCKLTGATLLVAKLDRLTRNLHFLTTLEQSGVAFVAADMPEVNQLMIHIMVSFAQHEREMISERTKKALGALRGANIHDRPKAWRGRTDRMGHAALGCPAGAGHLRRYGNSAAVAARHLITQERDEVLGPILRDLRQGGETLSSTAAKLAALGVTTPRGGKWDASAVKRVCDRIGNLKKDAKVTPND